jgi:hypothetical protein
MTDLRTVSIPVSRAIAMMAGLALMWYGAALVTASGIALMLLGLTMAVTAFVLPTVVDDKRLVGSRVATGQAPTAAPLHRR